MRDCWKNYSFEYTDLCWQSDIGFLMCCLVLSQLFFQGCLVPKCLPTLYHSFHSATSPFPYSSNYFFVKVKFLPWSYSLRYLQRAIWSWPRGNQGGSVFSFLLSFPFFLPPLLFSFSTSFRKSLWVYNSDSFINSLPWNLWIRLGNFGREGRIQGNYSCFFSPATNKWVDTFLTCGQLCWVFLTPSKWSRVIMGFPMKDISKTGSNVEATSFSPSHHFLRKENDSKISNIESEIMNSHWVGNFIPFKIKWVLEEWLKTLLRVFLSVVHDSR